MRRAAAAAFIALSLASTGALAQDLDAGTGEADALVARIDADAQRLQSEDCSIACSALQSMMRASDRLCSIEPELRCRSARDKVKVAVERVRTFCPECVASSIGAAETPRKEALPEAPSPAPPDSMKATEAAPGKHGGCAGCATSSTEDGAHSALGIAIAALLIAMRRRSKRRPRSR